jgi:hypothetical protein
MMKAAAVIDAHPIDDNVDRKALAKKTDVEEEHDEVVLRMQAYVAEADLPPITDRKQ